MGLAMDTILATRTAGGGGADTTFQATVLATGDSNVVRNFNPQTLGYFYDLVAQYSTAGAQFRVRSPLFHDNVQGIKYIPGETLARLTIPKETGQMLRPQDNLTIEAISNAASEWVAEALFMFYQDLPGAAARLHTWADISGLIKNIKPLLVAAPEAGTRGQWQDTVITTTEDLTKANTDYAVLGFMTDTLETAIAVKGPDTANLRIGVPGDVRTDILANWFVTQSDRHQLPMIPVINAANKGATFVSVGGRTTGGTPNVSLVLAELAHTVG